MASTNEGPETGRDVRRRAFLGIRRVLPLLAVAAISLHVSPGEAQVVPTALKARAVSSGDSSPKTDLVALKYDYPSGATDVIQKYFVIRPNLEIGQSPKAILVMFVGGRGSLQSVSGDNCAGGSCPALSFRSYNPLVRERWAFAAAGPFVVVLVERSTNWGSLTGNRLKGNYMRDVANVIADLRNNPQVCDDGVNPDDESPDDSSCTASSEPTLEDLPIWLVGHSRGTIAAAFAAAALGDGANGDARSDGLVLLGPVLDDDNNGDLFNIDELQNSAAFHGLDPQLVDITQPTLIAGHEDDTCQMTPPKGILMDDFVADLTGVSKLKLEKLFKGGYPALSDGCDSLSPHGYFGTEQKLVEKITKFIKDNSPPSP